VLTLPGVRPTFTASLLARFSYAMFPLALILAVEEAAGSYAVAGACVGVFALTSVLMPLKARAIDRHGQRRVLPLFGLGFLLAVAATAAAVQLNVSSPAVYLVLSVLAGLAAPPIGPCMRALWAELAPQTDLRQRAYGLDSAAEESLYILGPVVAGALVLLTTEGAALLVVALLNAGGAVAMAASRAATTAAAPAASQAGDEHPPRRAGGPFTVPGFTVLVLALFLIGLGTGPVDIAVTARAEQGGNAADAGWALAAFALGSVVGGLAWGRWRHTSLVSRQLAALVALTGVGLVVAGLATPLLLTAAALVLAGLAMSPAFVVAYVASDNLVSDANRNEANTWVSTANNGGVALGAAAAGAAIDSSSTATALYAGAAVLLVTAAGLLLAHGRLQPLQADDAATEPVAASD
jgi:MFS family permease